ncbi:MAG: tRNA (adenosine(37)-N6)-threonylcarbamoyltransferase complex dimerization subunit type 1 TsaB [Rhodospirillales bacterium]|nr:tRNA (adenosine(37)-N6)-threonylcarbamoyltransferase complex dimerization subunit type 1 TsaB [Rhodospirillales bacterium]
MKILAIETSGAACSAALWSEGDVRERTVPMARGHAERLVPLIGEVLAEAETAYRKLDLVAVTVGPGTFTGMRVGLATARGIALATGRPCLGVTSFDCVLEAAQAEAEVAWSAGLAVLVVLDSRRSEVFAQRFEAPAGLPQEPLVAPPEELASRATGVGLVVGTAAAAMTEAGLRGGTQVLHVAPSAAAVARVANRRWTAGARPAGFPDPLYLRAPETGAVAQ